MDYSKVDLDGLIEMGPCFSCTLNTLLKDKKGHPISPLLHDEVNQVPQLPTLLVEQNVGSPNIPTSMMELDKDVGYIFTLFPLLSWETIRAYLPTQLL